MQLFTSEVRGGAITLPEGVTLPEGTCVVVVVENSEIGFELSPAEESELAESIAEADRGEVVSAADLLRRLKRR